MKSWALCAIALAACGGDGTNAAVDAGPRADAAPACPAPTTPLSTGTHTLFLSFEGVTITLGDCDDALTNCSSLVTESSTAIPAFTNAARATTIAAMVTEALAPFSVNVVTTRPTTGTYRMVSIGGDSSHVVMVDGLVAVKPVCDATKTSGIAFVLEEDDELADRGYADIIAGAFGRLVGLVPSTRSGDCMCMQQTCNHQQTCTFGTSSGAVIGNACMRTTQNEQQHLIDAVGCR